MYANNVSKLLQAEKLRLDNLNALRELHQRDSFDISHASHPVNQLAAMHNDMKKCAKSIRDMVFSQDGNIMSAKKQEVKTGRKMSKSELDANKKESPVSKILSEFDIFTTPFHNKGSRLSNEFDSPPSIPVLMESFDDTSSQHVTDYSGDFQNDKMEDNIADSSSNVSNASFYDETEHVSPRNIISNPQSESKNLSYYEEELENSRIKIKELEAKCVDLRNLLSAHISSKSSVINLSGDIPSTKDIKMEDTEYKPDNVKIPATISVDLNLQQQLRALTSRNYYLENTLMEVRVKHVKEFQWMKRTLEKQRIAAVNSVRRVQYLTNAHSEVEKKLQMRDQYILKLESKLLEYIKDRKIAAKFCDGDNIGGSKNVDIVVPSSIKKINNKKLISKRNSDPNSSKIWFTESLHDLDNCLAVTEKILSNSSAKISNANCKEEFVTPFDKKFR